MVWTKIYKTWNVPELGNPEGELLDNVAAALGGASDIIAACSAGSCERAPGATPDRISRSSDDIAS